jgi:hypothetical protein
MRGLATATLLAMALGVAGDPAQSRSLQIQGTAGYLSEWELSGTVTERTSSGSPEFVGPLIWKHVGLCSANGPEEKRGEIKYRVERSGAMSRITATMSLEGVECAYTGDFSDAARGLMDCSNAKGIPLSISIR